MQKKGKSLIFGIAPTYNKSPMGNDYRELKISCIMSTDCNHTNIYTLLHNL
jgi:hypothetical protein